MKRFLVITGEAIIWVAVFGVVVWGLPRALSVWLKTPYPLASVTSSSMWPVLKRGDLILIEGVLKEEFVVGDIVVWKNAEGFTIHRVTALNQKTLVTKGDGNFEDDAPVLYEDVVGRAFKIRGKPARVPYLGFVTITLSKYTVSKPDIIFNR